ncbi:MAG: lysophospholipid acyltransferase family protein, partial [Bacteroidota bacterium]
VGFVMATMGIKTELTGHAEPNENPILYVCNHRSFTDPIIVSRYINAYAISKAEVGNYPLISTGAQETGVIYVKRNDRKSRNATKDAIEQAMGEGKNILIYPEGTTGNQETTKEFKRGSFDVAAKHGYAVVPIILEYKNRNLDYWFERGLGAQMYRQYSKAKTYTKIHFDNPIKDEDGQRLMEKAQAAINHKIMEMHNHWK